MIVRFRVDMKTDGTVVVFRKIEYLVYRLFKLDFGSETVGQLERIGFPKLAVAGRFVDSLDREVLSF